MSNTEVGIRKKLCDLMFAWNFNGADLDETLDKIEALINSKIIAELKNLMKNSKYKSYVPNEDIKQRIKKLGGGNG